MVQLVVFSKRRSFKAQGEEEEAELLERLMVGKKLPIRLAHLKRKEWKKDLKKDRTQLIAIHEKAAAVTADRDAKLQELKRLIQDKINHPLNDDNRKVLVFTAFSDTAQYLYANLKLWVSEKLDLHCALVTGSGDNRTTFKQAGYARQTDFISILTNFSPRSKVRTMALIALTSKTLYVSIFAPLSVSWSNRSQSV